MRLNKNINVGPRVAMVAMAVVLLLLFVEGLYLDISSTPRPLHTSFYVTWAALSIILLAATYWWLSKALKIRSWKRWAQIHGGRYERPSNMYITEQGAVLDKLSGHNPHTHKPFFLYRVVRVPIFFTGGGLNNKFPSSFVLISASDEIDFPSKFDAKKKLLNNCADS